MIRIILFLLCVVMGSVSCTGNTPPKTSPSIKNQTNTNGGLIYFASKQHRDDLAIQNPYIVGALYTIYWSELEKSKGEYDWSELDEFFKKWSAGGKKVAIRVIWISTGLWPHEVARHPSPDWLWKEGAKYYYDEKTQTEIPLFWDPIYNKHALRLMQAIYDRYGKDPNLLFVSATPGYETFPCHPKTGSVSTNFFEDFSKVRDSQGRAYSPELWKSTVKNWISSISARKALSTSRNSLMVLQACNTVA
mgnify:FL=1